MKALHMCNSVADSSLYHYGRRAAFHHRPLHSFAVGCGRSVRQLAGVRLASPFEQGLMFGAWDLGFGSFFLLSLGLRTQDLLG